VLRRQFHRAGNGYHEPGPTVRPGRRMAPPLAVPCPVTVVIHWPISVCSLRLSLYRGAITPAFVRSTCLLSAIRRAISLTNKVASSVEKHATGRFRQGQAREAGDNSLVDMRR